MLERKHLKWGEWRRIATGFKTLGAGPEYEHAEYFIVTAAGTVITSGKSRPVMQFYGTSTMTEADLGQSYTVVQTLRRHKEEHAADACLEFAQDLIGKRSGIQGYRGYFKVVDIEPLMWSRTRRAIKPSTPTMEGGRARMGDRGGSTA